MLIIHGQDLYTVEPDTKVNNRLFETILWSCLKHEKRLNQWDKKHFYYLLISTK